MTSQGERPSQEMDDYLRKLKERLPRYAQIAAGVEPGAKGSAEWLQRIGRFCWEARERAGLLRADVAERMEVDPHSITMLDCGVADETELNEDFLRKFFEAVGDPSLFDKFIEEFGPL